MGAAAAIALAPLVQDRAPDTALPLSVVDGAERVAMLGAQTFLRGQYLRIDHFGLRPAAGHALQLWLLRDGSGRPRSLGRLATGDSVTVLPLSERIDSGDVLAVSEEPPGGSPGSGPSGPVIVTARVGTKI
jgi:anti-sigma-K factor RskA